MIRTIHQGEIVPNFRFFILLRDHDTRQLVAYVKLPYWRWLQTFSYTPDVEKKAWHQLVMAYRQGNGWAIVWMQSQT